MKPENRLHKNEKTLTNEDRAFKLRVKGWSQCKIAGKLGMTQQGVSKALKRATCRYTKAFLADIRHVKNEQVAQLEHIAHEAIEAWYKSKTGSTNENNHGDPRYLAEFRKAKQNIRETLGFKYLDDAEDDSPPLSEIRINIIKPEYIPDDDDNEI